MLPQAVSDHYRAQQRLIVATLGLTRREWSTVTWDNIDDSWAKVAPRVNLLTASAQLGAATNGAAYVGRTLADLGQSVDPLGAVNPRAFAGFASDGRPLGSLLEGAKARAKMSGSLDAGGRWLDMAVHTQIADAGRGAAATAIAVRPGVGWVRMVNPPCCGPCAVLSGREYRYSQGFDRHPRCDCVHVPTTDTAGALDNLTTEPTLDQIKGLTEGERKALLEGGDLSRVINARRGGGLGKMSTTELAKRGRVRLTPDGIFATAKDRDEALALLRTHGYVTPTARRVAATATRPAPVATVAPKAVAPQVRMGKLIEAPDGKGAVPLKGHGPGRSLTESEWDEALRGDSGAFNFASQDFRYIADPDDRATGVLQYDFDSAEFAKRAAVNIREGRDVWDGISTAALDEQVSYKVITDKRWFPDGGSGYTVNDYRDDIEGAARKLLEWDADRTEDLGKVYKGVNFNPDLSWAQVRAQLDLTGLNFTSVTDELQTAAMYAGRADRSKSVVLEFEDARGIWLDSVGGMASKTESLVSGDYDFVGFRIEQDPDGWGERMFVQVRKARR